MPLPPALAAKLAKRGLIEGKQKQAVDSLKKSNFKGVSTCPNKNNIFHECNNWCEIHWKGISTPDPRYIRNMQKLLLKYPLPNNWTEVFDKGIGRYYYWNIENDLVTWLPPKHPKSVLTKCASKLREKRLLDLKEKRTITKDDYHHNNIINNNNNNKRSLLLVEKDTTTDRSDSDEEERNNYHRSSSSRHAEKRERSGKDRHLRNGDKDKRSNNRKEDLHLPLDPMDPAAYSDIPQGTWNDGLETNKTRAADSTATGALFQQRPYPAPGAVLAANRSGGGEKEDTTKEKRK